ncbi:MAG: hypothetical protein JOY93_03150 [Acidobacteriales bacterium]|nr:hypothetical protein [Terriglobales bacterium]
MKQQCQRCSELFSSVAAVLDDLTSLTRAQSEAFKAGDMDEFTRLDKELENAVGLKERSIGALREHRREHGLAG